MSFKTDYEYGKLQEQIILNEIIENHFFFKSLKHCTDIYSPFDFYDDEYEIELKSRNCHIDKYPTTLIPCDKVERKAEKDVILMFAFNHPLYWYTNTKDIYYIFYTKKKFEKFTKKLFVRNKRNDFNDKKKYYFEIPIEELRRIEDFCPFEMPIKQYQPIDFSQSSIIDHNDVPFL